MKEMLLSTLIFAFATIQVADARKNPRGRGESIQPRTSTTSTTSTTTDLTTELTPVECPTCSSFGSRMKILKNKLENLQESNKDIRFYNNKIREDITSLNVSLDLSMIGYHVRTHKNVDMMDGGHVDMDLGHQFPGRNPGYTDSGSGLFIIHF